MKPAIARAIALLRRLRHGRRGATAIEFALVFPVFMVFTAMIMENGLMLVDQAFLDFATADASRLIRTGQVQEGSGETGFQTKLCADVTPLISCSGLQVNVESAPNPGFGSLNAAVQSNASGTLTDTNFSPGGPGDDVVVQVAYKRNYLFGWVSSSAMALVFSTSTFQNEKYTGP
jgi:Flp pilus assembly protein TadG